MVESGTEQLNETKHYVHCDYCGRDQADWSVIVDESGECVQLECRRCGGTGWERGQEANHA